MATPPDEPSQEPRAGQPRTKSALVRQDHPLPWRVPLARDGQGRSYANITCCFCRFFAKGRVANLATYPGQTRTNGTIESGSEHFYHQPYLRREGACHHVQETE